MSTHAHYAGEFGSHPKIRSAATRMHEALAKAHKHESAGNHAEAMVAHALAKRLATRVANHVGKIAPHLRTTGETQALSDAHAIRKTSTEALGTAKGGVGGPPKTVGAQGQTHAEFLSAQADSLTYSAKSYAEHAVAQKAHVAAHNEHLKEGNSHMTAYHESAVVAHGEAMKAGGDAKFTPATSAMKVGAEEALKAHFGWKSPGQSNDTSGANKSVGRMKSLHEKMLKHASAGQMPEARIAAVKATRHAKKVLADAASAAHHEAAKAIIHAAAPHVANKNVGPSAPTAKPGKAPKPVTPGTHGNVTMMKAHGEKAKQASWKGNVEKEVYHAKHAKTHAEKVLANPELSAYHAHASLIREKATKSLEKQPPPKPAPTHAEGEAELHAHAYKLGHKATEAHEAALKSDAAADWQASAKAHAAAAKAFEAAGNHDKAEYHKSVQKDAENGGVSVTQVAYAHGFRELAEHEHSALVKKHRMEILPSEKSAELNYSGSAYHDINYQLRMGHPPTAEDRQLDSAISRSVAPENMMVHRGAGEKHLFDHLKPGQVFVDEAFVSTSNGKKAAFTSKETQFHISVPKGHPIAAIQSHSPGEREMLLPRKTKFRVTKVEKVGGKLHIHMELEPSYKGPVVRAKTSKLGAAQLPD